jgi:hypothetical protein
MTWSSFLRINLSERTSTGSWMDDIATVYASQHDDWGEDTGPETSYFERGNGCGRFKNIWRM